MSLKIVYEDDNIIICHKPAGQASQSDRTFERDLLSEVMTYRTTRKESPEVHIINRLDKPVEGLVLFAKNQKTARKLSAMSGEHSIEKKYYAVICGELNGNGEFKDYLIKESRENYSKVVSKDVAGAKKASLSYSVLDHRVVDGRTYSLVEVCLHTGRHHQIRVQFSSRGLPLYGDVKYNPEYGDRRDVTPGLFAYSLSFNNPWGVDRIKVEIQPQGNIWEFEYFNR